MSWRRPPVKTPSTCQQTLAAKACAQPDDQSSSSCSRKPIYYTIHITSLEHARSKLSRRTREVESGDVRMQQNSIVYQKESTSLTGRFGVPNGLDGSLEAHRSLAVLIDVRP